MSQEQGADPNMNPGTTSSSRSLSESNTHRAQGGVGFLIALLIILVIVFLALWLTCKSDLTEGREQTIKAAALIEGEQYAQATVALDWINGTD